MKAGVYCYGRLETEVHNNGDDWCPYFDESDIAEDNGMSFTVRCVAMSARDRNRLKEIFNSIAREWHVSFDGKRSKLMIEHNPADDDLDLPESWSFTWFFSPNE